MIINSFLHYSKCKYTTICDYLYSRYSTGNLKISITGHFILSLNNTILFCVWLLALCSGRVATYPTRHLTIRPSIQWNKNFYCEFNGRPWVTVNLREARLTQILYVPTTNDHLYWFLYTFLSTLKLHGAVRQTVKRIYLTFPSYDSIDNYTKFIYLYYLISICSKTKRNIISTF